MDKKMLSICQRHLKLNGEQEKRANGKALIKVVCIYSTIEESTASVFDTLNDTSVARL